MTNLKIKSSEHVNSPSGVYYDAACPACGRFIGSFSLMSALLGALAEHLSGTHQR